MKILLISKQTNKQNDNKNTCAPQKVVANADKKSSTQCSNTYPLGDWFCFLKSVKEHYETIHECVNKVHTTFHLWYVCLLM